MDILRQTIQRYRNQSSGKSSEEKLGFEIGAIYAAITHAASSPIEARSERLQQLQEDMEALYPTLAAHMHTKRGG